ncbi:MAG TPA: DUF2946 family protein [Crenalkalicoccus sp.]|nr:DUF2946 family protein [Crenalkalicoccus sp.]
MARRAPGLTLLLSLLLALQWGGAAAHCLAMLGQGQGVEVCTGHGIETVQLDASGQALPAAPADHGCACCAVGVAPPPAPPALAALPVAYVLEVPTLPAGRPNAPPRAPPQQPRAPPCT